MSSAGDSKAKLRAQVRRARRARTLAAAEAGAERAASARSCASHAVAAAASAVLAALPRSSCVAAYQALETEPPTEALIDQALSAGLTVIVPELLADNDLDWRAVRPDGSVGPLLGREALTAAELIVVPALLLDRGGRRLGQGGGSYDRALGRRSPTALVIAVVGDEELVDDPLPVDAHDAAVDGVITPGGGLVVLAPVRGTASARPPSRPARP